MKQVMWISLFILSIMAGLVMGQTSDIMTSTFLLKEVSTQNLLGSLVSDVAHEGNPDTIPPVSIRITRRDVPTHNADTIGIGIAIDTDGKDTTYVDSTILGRYMRVPSFNWSVTAGVQRGIVPNRFLHVRIDTVQESSGEFYWQAKVPEGTRVWSNDTTYQDLVR